LKGRFVSPHVRLSVPRSNPLLRNRRETNKRKRHFEYLTTSRNTNGTISLSRTVVRVVTGYWTRPRQIETICTIARKNSADGPSVPPADPTCCVRDNRDPNPRTDSSCTSRVRFVILRTIRGVTACERSFPWSATKKTNRLRRRNRIPKIDEINIRDIHTSEKVVSLW